MKIGFTKATRKMRARFEVSDLSNGAYFYEDDFIVGKLIDNELLQLVVQDEDGIKLLVLARGIKRKCGQELIVTDMMFVDLFADNKLVKCVKKRQFDYAEYPEVSACGVKPIGKVQSTCKGMKIEIPKLGVDEEICEFEKFDGRRVHILNSRAKQVKQN